MNQNIATDKALHSIQQQLKEKLTEAQGVVVHDHLSLLFGVGFNEGLKESHINKQVGQFTEEGLFHKFRSVKDAAAYMNVHSSSIYEVLYHPKRKCKGFYWKYI
jgi:hypothetical protein